jgi:ribose/xylose/arabinose/galactoside ABC-type transport system permease subunit
MEREPFALLVGIAFAIGLGFFTARSSNNREAIHGGSLAQLFHFIGAASFTGVLPVVLTSLILGGGFGLAFPLAVSFVAVSFVSLIVFAIIERPALNRYQLEHQERGWTEEDARSSGL